MELEKPRITVQESTSGRNAKIIVEPLERGYGTTLGNLMRRVLLSNLSGTAVTAIRIEGAPHEFTTVKGVVEDITDIVLNVKSLVLKCNASDINYTTIMRINRKEAGPVYAKDIAHDSEIEICNPNQLICTLDGGTEFNMFLSVANGRGYVVAKDQVGATDTIGYIAVDSLFSPVEKASFFVEPARVGQNIAFDKLTLEVSTNGSITAKEVASLAGKLVNEHLNMFVDLVKGMDEQEILVESAEDKEVKILETSIEDLELSPRSTNCLRRGNINTIQDLISKTKSEMLRVRNLGAKSLEEIEAKLAGFELGFKAEEENI
ncbi:MAG: DNA-directed RNA polymerase subunit alpha [Christensenellaceae bacterium]|nr:DNA-directed RNA polymerase subunit alpha [Christensenellaceae bacterium]